MVENGAAVLGAAIHALAVFGRGIMHAVEKQEEGGVGDDGGIEGYLKGFGV